MVEQAVTIKRLEARVVGAGAEHFLALRAYLSTTRKQGHHALDTLTRLATHDAWIPQTTDP